MSPLVIVLPRDQVLNCLGTCYSPLFLFNYNKCCLCVILQTGQSWHWSRITNSGRCYCHALHSLGCIWRMQSSSISLHCKLLNHSASQRNITFCRVLQILTHDSMNIYLNHQLQIFQVLCALTLPVGKLVVDYVLKNHEVNTFLFQPAFPWKIKPFFTDLWLRLQDNAKIFMAKYYCVRLHALFGMALASGLVLARNGILAWQMRNLEIHGRDPEQRAPPCRQPSIALRSELLNAEIWCSTELAQICQEMERKCQGGTRCPLATGPY